MKYLTSTNVDPKERSRNWCFTLNNWTEDEYNHLKEGDNFRYLVCGKEVGEETGTPHLQGYIVFANAVRMATVKKTISPRVHLAIAKGNAEQNRVYCTKGGDYIEMGQRPATSEEKGNANKRRYEEAWNASVEGRFDEIDRDILMRHYGTVKRIRMDVVAARDLQNTEEQMEWWYGPTGVGKSFKAREMYPDCFPKMCNKWWDSYVDQETVLIDDFDVKHAVLVHHLKIWGDRYPFLAEIKGGSTKIRPRKIIVTSNWHPSQIWTESQDLAPILRRFKVTKFTAFNYQTKQWTTTEEN